MRAWVTTILKTLDPEGVCMQLKLMSKLHVYIVLICVLLAEYFGVASAQGAGGGGGGGGGKFVASALK